MKIPITETRIVLSKPTKYALKYEWDPSYSIRENWTSKEDSCDKNPYPKSIPLFSILTCALYVKKPKIRTTAITVINCGPISLSLKFTILIIYEFKKKGLDKSSPF